MIPKELITVLTKAIKFAEETTYKDIKKGNLALEEDITADLMKTIKLYCSDVIQTNEVNFGPYQVFTRIFKKSTEEPNVGADLAITISKYENKKNGFRKKVGVKTALIQSKLPSNKDYSKLKEQIEDMQEYTDESYVAVYNQDGVYVSHSKDVIDANYRVKNISNEKLQTLNSFFKDFFSCSKGEKGFDSRDILNKDEDIYYKTPLTNILEFVVTPND
ncbi:hypothetical protein J2B92_20485 [Lysinibacillus sphaericus]|uniref:hypothetical protein n=1 Tax=Lysinibacillus sphaericus TaxID=1421 RepID=UPI0018CE0CCA|nr:hypothetical protein [Lysinibacillus sphaericus]MBG9754284.1 hypothetical protein [Lysinibacillus sphaericus]QTB13118.1 hypothetical protein J2B92_20485 [Lysinibacillus sphaericus]